MLSAFLVTEARPILMFRMKKMPPNTDGSCDYIEYAVANSREGVDFQLESWV
jgi:hypothetical protein